MASEIDQLKSDLKDSQAATGRYQDHIKALEGRRDALQTLVEGLEADVARLEAEGLKPLVDRLRTQIGAMRTLLAAMGDAIATLTGDDDLGKEVAAAIDDLPQDQGTP